MYCSNCGAKAGGNFCSTCGQPLTGKASSPSAPPPPPIDWAGEIRYDVLTAIPEVRDLVSRQAAESRSGMTGEKILQLFDAVSPLGFSLETVTTNIALPLWTKLGLKTGKNESRVIPKPPGNIIVAALCSVARRGQPLQGVRQLDDGCLLEVETPSDVRALKSSLHVLIRRDDRGTLVDANAQSSGQIYDWGKSKSVLENLFADIDELSRSSSPHM